MLLSQSVACKALQWLIQPLAVAGFARLEHFYSYEPVKQAAAAVVIIKLLLSNGQSLNLLMKSLE